MAEDTNKAKSTTAGSPVEEARQPSGSPEAIKPAETDDEAIAGNEGYTFFEMLSTLPDRLQSYLLSEDLGQLRVDIYDRLKLSSEDRSIALFVELGVFFGDVELVEYPDELWTLLPWKDDEQEKARELVRETVGRIFLPARTFLGDMQELLETIGIDPKDYPSEQIESQTVTYDQAVEGVLGRIEATDLDEAGLRRLKGIVESMFRGVRNKDSAVQMLMRPRKTGGLEMEFERADQIIALVEDEMKLTKYVDELPEKDEASQDRNEVTVEETEESKTEYSPEEIRQRLAGSSDEQQALAAAGKRLNEAFGSDTQALKDALNKIVYAKPGQADRWEAAALLLLAARGGLLLEALSGDTRFAQAVKAYLEEKGRKTQYLSAVRGRPSGPKAVNAFLQLVLCGVVGLSDEDAARYGLRVTNLLKKKQPELAGLVAFDLDRGQFVWTDPIK